MKFGILGINNISTLTLTPGIGKISILQIINTATLKPSTLNELLYLILEAKHIYPKIRIPSLEQLEKAEVQGRLIIEQSRNMDINLIGIDDARYPDSLRSIDTPPVLLNVKGDLSRIQNIPAVAVVGTRSPSDYGRIVGDKIAQKFASSGLVIVSGLALGCDTAAHEGCLKAGGKTIAILAHGLDTIYPPENRELSKQIFDSGGCLLSEYHIGVKPGRHQFIERDRLQSGLSRAVVVIETGITGGTMHTVGFCLKQGKKLACINYPSENRSIVASGNQKLINEGKAIPLWNKEDVEKFIKEITSNSQPLPHYSNEAKIVSTIESAPEAVPISPDTELRSIINIENSSSENVSLQSILFPELIKAVPSALTAKALAKRLGTSPAMLISQREIGIKHLFEWTQNKDPDGIGWKFSKSKKQYIKTDNTVDSHSS